MVEALARRRFVGALFEPDGTVAAVWPGAPAERAGLQPGDRIVAAEGAPIDGPDALTDRLRRRAPGECVRLTVTRDGEPRTLLLPVEPCPVESIAGADVVLGEIAVDGVRQRTVITRPHGSTGAPVVLLLPGITLDSVEVFPPRPSPWTDLIAVLSAAGFASLRIERRGLGDSEGGPAHAVDFESERRAAVAAMDQLGAQPGLDAASVVVFGHSVGGMLAPLLAGPRVRGFVVYGTWARPFTAAMGESSRRQRPGAAGAAANRLDHALLGAVVERGESIAAAIAADPELVGAPALGARDTIFGRTPAYLRGLQALDLAAAWRSVNVPTLALHGSRDVITTFEQHVEIQALVHCGSAKADVRELDGVAHDMTGATSALAECVAGFARTVCID